ncbi:CYFIP-related Rac1 interactor B-like [Amphiura filiformis]|uniref:CYFIP-related Rac1 interactor B-like n=1 Tax=Amphiura filiformis TaxID=82378 RepID=UPI003B222AE8
MGNLLKLLSREDGGAKYDIFLDFENAQPTEMEKDIYQKVNETLSVADTILQDLQRYRGAGEEIRIAIQNPQDVVAQDRAWQSVCPLVARLKRYYEYSQDLALDTVPQLLHALCSGPMTPQQHLETQQALAKQFAEILHFTLKFDDLKMTNPAIQNDFSYYRRTLSRMKMSNQEDDYVHAVDNEMANRMSLFYAQATPMLKVLSDATTKFVSENKSLPIENTTDVLSTMALICRAMIENSELFSRFQNEDTMLFCLRVMVGLIILYDHVHPMGAFQKNCPIDVKGCVKVLKDQPPTKVETLLNALRYTTKHLNDESTPKNIKKDLMQ